MRPALIGNGRSAAIRTQVLFCRRAVVETLANRLAAFKRFQRNPKFIGYRVSPSFLYP